MLDSGGRFGARGRNVDDRVRTNWAGNQQSTPAVLVRPRSVPELRAAVRHAVAIGQTPCVVRGSMHSWSPVAIQEGGTAFDLRAMVSPPRIDAAAGTATVSAAMWLDEVGEALAEVGLALPFVPTIGDITAAGAAATDSHGADRIDGRFIDLVRSLRLIDGLGRDIFIDAQGCFRVPEEGPMEPLIAGAMPLFVARAHLGLLGAVHELTLRCVPAFDLAFVQAAARERAAFGRGYAKLRAFLDSHEHSDFFWFRPWARVLMRASDTTTQPRAPRGWLARRLIDGLFRTRVGSAAIRLCGTLPFLTPVVSLAAAHTFLGRTVLRDRSDRVATYLPGHVRQDVHFQTMEYGIPYGRMEDGLEIVRDVTRGFATPVPLYVRRVGDTLHVEFIWPDGLRGGRATARALEARLVDAFGGAAMPHPGKLCFQNPVNRMPLQQRQDFLALKRELDPQGVFTNSWMREYLAGTPDLGPFMHTWRGAASSSSPATRSG